MAQTEEQLQMAEKGAKDLGFDSVEGAKDVLSTKTLQDTPDFQVQDAGVPTAGAGLSGAIEAETDAFTENLKKQREEAQTIKEGSQTEIQDILSQIRGETGLTIEAENDAGLPEVEAELKDINQQILTEQNALRRQIERIEENKQGRFGGAVQDKIEEAKRSSLRKQADLSVIQMGIQGRYDSAKAIADRAVNAQMERQEIILNTAMFNYQENKELFTKAEQREFEALAQNRQNEIDTEKEKLQTISDLSLSALQGGAPTSVVTAMRQSKDLNEAISIGGQYVGAGERALRNAQIANIYDQINQRKLDANKKVTEATTKEEEKRAKDEADVEKALEIKQLASELLKETGLSPAVGAGFKKTVLGSIPFVSSDAVAGTARADFEAQAGRIADLLTLDNLDLMSGVLSETDIKILERSGSNIKNFDMTEKQYKEEVNRIIDVMDRTIKNKGMTAEQAEFYSGLDESEIDELDTIFGVDTANSTEAFDPAKFF